MATGPTIVARFLADTSDLTSGVDKASSKLGGLKKAALIAGGAFAVGEVVQFGKAAVEAAAADEAAQQQLAAALRNTTGATDKQIASSEDYISKLSMSAAIADDELRPALATLARGFGDTEDAQAALTLATDVAAGTGKDLSTVTEAMMKAALGNTGALKKMGVEVKNADGSAKSLDEIMSDMSETFKGQAAVAANSTAGQMKKAEIAMGELQETIGAALLPVIATLAAFLVTDLMPAFAAVFGFVVDHKEAVLAVLIAVGITIGAAVIPAFIAWAAAAGAAAIATLVAAAPFIALGAVIAGVAFLIIHNWDTIAAASKAVWEKVTGFVSAAFDWIKRNWPLLLAIITGPIGLAVLAIQKNWDTIKNGATAVYDWIKAKFDAIAGAIDAILGPITRAVGKVVSAITGPINGVIRAWNNFEFRVPSIKLPEFDTHIPGVGKIGGGTIGGWSIPFPNIPELAGGGVLTSPTLFLGGEAGTEIVAPEEMLRAIVAEESRGNYTLNLYTQRADEADVAYAFRRLELLAGAT